MLKETVSSVESGHQVQGTTSLHADLEVVAGLFQKSQSVLILAMTGLHEIQERLMQADICTSESHRKDGLLQVEPSTQTRGTSSSSQT